ncbi:5-methyltetrahydropteroyltriglutamate--homocysteine S-methyltransferase, partial [Sarracenia purpurea var. burkii]
IWAFFFGKITGEKEGRSLCKATRGFSTRGFPTSDSQWDLLLSESGCVQGKRKQTKAVVRDLNPTWNEVVNFNVGKKPSKVFDDVLEVD